MPPRLFSLLIGNLLALALSVEGSSAETAPVHPPQEHEPTKTSQPPALFPAKAQFVHQRILEAGSDPAPASLKLAEEEEARYHIHVGPEASPIVRNAARELGGYLEKISGGVFLPLSQDAHPLAGPLLIVGRNNALTAKLWPDLDFAGLGEDGFVIRTAGPHILIAGNTPGGTMYGVNWFLDRKLGVKWLSPDFTHVPVAKTIQVARLNETQIPRFRFRQILSFEGQNKPFAAHNLLNGNSHGAFGQASPSEIDHWDNSWQRPGLTASFYQLLPPSQYQAEHPDWYAGGQMAMMNPEMREAMAAQIVQRLRAVPHHQEAWFGLMDNDWSWDLDAQSAAFAEKHGGVPSAPRVDMAIDVARRVQKELPGAKLAINAYHWSFTPPKGLSIPDDMLVFPMTIHVDYSFPLNEGPNAQLGRDIAAWNRIAQKVLAWDHLTNFAGFLQPTPNIYPLAESVQWLAGLDHVCGYFGEGSWNTRGAEFASLRVWLMGRMLWDPQTNPREAVAEYCHAYFGPAGKVIKEYLDFIHAEARRTKAPLWEKTNVDCPLLNFDFLVQADDFMEQAEAAVRENPIFLAHVRQIRLGIDYVVLLRHHEFEAAAKSQGVAWSADLADRRSRFDDTVKAESITQYRQGGNMKELAALMDIKRRPSQPPALVKDLPATDWREIQDLGINRYGQSTVIVADPAASDGVAVRLDGTSKIWGIQLKMHRIPQEGQWDVYADVRVEAEGATDADLAAGLGSAPPRNRFREIPYRDMQGDGYHTFKIPGGPFRHQPNDQAISYVRSPHNGKIKFLYVDRFFLVRISEKIAPRTVLDRQ